MKNIKTKHMLKKAPNSSRQTIKGRKSDCLYNQDIFRDERVAEIAFDVKCSYIEIYNETIFDLLDGLGHSKL